VFRFIEADLRRHSIGALAIALLIALATALGVVVTLQERAVRLGSARAANAFDLVVGAPGSETQLVLSSVFLQAAPLPLLPGSVFARLSADPRVAWAAPIGFGDFAGDNPIVGTNQALIDGIGGLTEGRTLEKLGDAIAGAQVRMDIGDRFHPMHGQSLGAPAMHGGATYRIVGRMKATGTPWDRAVLVPIEAVWRIHGHGAEEAEGVARVQGSAAGGFDVAAATDPKALSAEDAPGLPAILVKPRTLGDAYRLRLENRNEHTLAVFPGEVLTRLYGTLGDARFILSVVAAGAQALVAAALLLVVTVHVLQRRRQIGALRAFGAPRLVVFAIVWLETVVVVGAGLLAGFGIGWLAARLLSSVLSRASGIAFPVEFVGGDVLRLIVLLGVSGLVAIVPAMLAYRQSPASALWA
jgi:putative ABC transport system permease protein